MWYTLRFDQLCLCLSFPTSLYRALRDPPNISGPPWNAWQPTYEYIDHQTDTVPLLTTGTMLEIVI